MEAANIKYDHVEKTYLRRYMSNKHKNKNGTCVTFLLGVAMFVHVCIIQLELHTHTYNPLPISFFFFRFVKYYCEACFFYWN